MSTPGARMGLFGRIRSSLRRQCVRYGQDPRKKPGRTFGVRWGRRGYSRLKLPLAIAVAVTVGIGLLLAARTRREDRDMDEFIKGFQDMYDEEGKSGAGRAAPGADGDREVASRYDPKARAFVDPKMRQKWGMEAEKGREKRRLFMEVHDMSQAKGRPQLTLNQLMEMPSSFDHSKGVSDTTIILNQWKRTTLPDQLKAILAQTVRPTGGVWVCVFDSPRETEYRKVVEMYGDRFKDSGGLFFISSSFNFKYYGRFQMALQARTKYVWIVDDDVMPGKKFLEQLSHIAGIPEAEEADGTVGPMALGSVGWIMPGVKPSNGNFYSYRYHTDKGGLFLPDKRYGIPVPHLQEVDLLCSHWFLQTDWVRLLFREKWETPETAEDYMLAYSLRKYAGVRSFVLPMDLHDSQTWGNTDVDWSMQHQGAGGTTLRSTVPMRDRIWHRLLKRGGEYFMSMRYAPRPRPLILVIDGQTDAEALRPLFHVLQTSYPPMKGMSSSAIARDSSGAPLSAPQRPPRVVLTGRGGGSISCAKAAVILGNPPSGRGKRTTLCNPDNFASAWELMAGKHFPREGTGRSGGSGGRDHVLMADLARGLSGAVDSLEPLAIVSVAGSGPSAGVGEAGGGGAAIDEALGLVAGQSGVPLIRFPRKADASGAALWLSRLTPRAFAAWHRARVDIVVVYEPSDDSGDWRGGGGGSGSRGSGRGHTEAQLQVLLHSLSSADYLGDEVGVTVAIGSGAVPDFVGGFSWPHGSKVVRGPLRARPPPPFVTEDGDSAGTSGGGDKGGGRRGGGGALGALALHSWIPRDDHNFVIVLEADHVVSRLFYSWLKVAMLETTYGSGQLASSALPTRGVCVPGTGGEGGGGGGGTGGGGKDVAWLLPAGHWRAVQARCLADHARGGGGGAGGEGSCEVEGYPRAPERSLCPSLEPGKALIARTGQDGLLSGGLKSLMGDDKALANLVKRVLFPQPDAAGG